MKNIILIIILLFILSCCTVPQEEPEWVNAIFIMDDDGSNVTHLIDDCPENVQFTPDGTKIILNRWSIWTINIDGTECKPIMDSLSVLSELPSIYSDSLGYTKIIFSAYRDEKSPSDVYIMDIDGTNLQNITNTPDIRERYPHFSSDGNQIVYTTRQDSINSIYIMDASGANKTKVISNSTKYYTYSYPIFNSSGDTIFYKYIGLPRGLYSINVDGTNNTILYEGWGGFSFPSVSADGKKIVFYADIYIFIMNEDGTDITKLAEGGEPMISSNGEKIVFGGVKIMNSDGSGLTKLEYGWHPRFSNSKYKDNYKIVYIGERKITKKGSKGILF